MTTDVLGKVIAEMRELLADEMRWHFDKPTVSAWADQLAAVRVEGGELEVFNCARCPVSVESKWLPPDCPECGDPCQLDPTAKPPAPSGLSVPVMPGNWPEDASHENGDYECQCVHCKATFYGHKRRVICKGCATQSQDAEAVAWRYELVGKSGEVANVSVQLSRWNLAYVVSPFGRAGVDYRAEGTVRETSLYTRPIAVDEAMVERALHARVPGGAEVWHWLPSDGEGAGHAPHETARAVIRAALKAVINPRAD